MKKAVGIYKTLKQKSKSQTNFYVSSTGTACQQAHEYMSHKNSPKRSKRSKGEQLLLYAVNLSSELKSKDPEGTVISKDYLQQRKHKRK